MISRTNTGTSPESVTRSRILEMILTRAVERTKLHPRLLSFSIKIAKVEFDDRQMVPVCQVTRVFSPSLSSGITVALVLRQLSNFVLVLNCFQTLTVSSTQMPCNSNVGEMFIITITVPGCDSSSIPGSHPDVHSDHLQTSKSVSGHVCPSTSRYSRYWSSVAPSYIDISHIVHILLITKYERHK